MTERKAGHSTARQVPIPFPLTCLPEHEVLLFRISSFPAAGSSNGSQAGLADVTRAGISGGKSAVDELIGDRDPVFMSISLAINMRKEEV